MKRYISAMGQGLWLLALVHLCGPALAGAGQTHASAPDGQLPAKRSALVVGIGTYAHWPALPHSIEDAQEMSDALSQEGFAVKLLIDPPSRDIRAALRKLADGAGQQEDQSVLIYFAGHGTTVAQADGMRMGWLIPADCPRRDEDPDLFEKRAVSIAQLAQLAEGVKSRHVLALLDTALAADALKVSAPSLNLLGIKYRQPARQFIVAGRPGDDLPARSQFKHYLLKGLRGDADTVRDGYITGSELAVYLTQTLDRVTSGRQRPQYARLGKAGKPRGDYTLGTFKPEIDAGQLSITTQPAGAKVRVLNIKPKFKQGMALKPGVYLVEVTAANHLKWRDRVVIESGKHRSLKVALEKAATAFTNDLGITLTLVQAGRFQMGSAKSEKSRQADETFHENVLPRPFYMQTTEVTRDQFAQFIRETGYTTTAERSKQCWFSDDQGKWQASKSLNWRTDSGGKTVSAGKDGARPVACVSWNDAQAFVKWLSDREARTYRLPTEAQWEYACRAGTTTAFSTGACLSMELSNYNGTEASIPGCSVKTGSPSRAAKPVASFAPNAWGLYDMHGNLAEWCQDWYDLYPRQKSMASSGPRQGAEKVIRGGHFRSSAAGCRSARRFKLRPDFSSRAVGFRVVMVP